MTISGTPVSVDSSNRIYLGGTSSLNTDPPTILANGAVVLPLSNAVSIHGTTIIAGRWSLTISGAALFLDSSNNLFLHEPLATQPTPASQATKVIGVAAQSYSDDISIAGTALNLGASPVTKPGTRPITQLGRHCYRQQSHPYFIVVIGSHKRYHRAHFEYWLGRVGTGRSWNWNHNLTITTSDSE